jgi:hypothetical protein
LAPKGLQDQQALSDVRGLGDQFAPNMPSTSSLQRL